MEIEPIAHFKSPFASKFGIPKQSGLAENIPGRIVFEPKYRCADALRGLEEFDYLWIIWEFSANRHAAASPVVRPPLLGGNTKMGVFATRSPFRPNRLGLSSVKISGIETDAADGPVIVVNGADLMDGTPIYDIKPYITYADSHEGVRCGFVDKHSNKRLEVDIPATIAAQLTNEEATALREVLSLDPRPRYQNDPDKVYGMPYAGRDVRFKVAGTRLTVVEIVAAKCQ